MMARKNRRRGGRELAPDLIAEIMRDNQSASSTGLRADAALTEDPRRPSASDQAYYAAVNACDRIVRELDDELRRMDHVRSGKTAGSCDPVQQEKS